MKRFLLAASILLAAAYFAAAYVLSGEITTFPVRSQEDVLKEAGLKSYQEARLSRPEDVRIPVNDVIIEGWLFMNPKNRRCAVLMQHGHASNRAGTLPYAQLFWPHGCHLFLFDARHHGSSSGVFATWGHREKNDLVVMVDWLARKTGVQRGRIGLFGVATGGAVVLQAAPALPDIAFIAVDSPFENLDTILKIRLARSRSRAALLLYPAAAWFAGLRGHFSTDEVNPLSSAHDVRVPVFITHSRADADVPFEHSQHIFDAIPHDQKTLLLTDNAGHSAFIRHAPAAYRRALDDFLKTRVDGFD